MGSCCKAFESCTFTHRYLSGRSLNMFSLKCVILLTLALYLVYLSDETEGMGICFGGYPACCSGGKNTCGPFCASCRRVPEVFRIINPDPHAFPDKDPFPAQPEHVRGPQ